MRAQRPVGPALLILVAACALVALAGRACATGRERPVAAADLPTNAELEARQARVGRVTVSVENVFDPSDPREDYWLYRTADKLHIQSREATIRSQLLFAGGEPYRARLLAESERLLRSRIYLFDAWIVPVAYDESQNTVDIVVTVRDVWTLSPNVSFGRAGGVNGTSLGLQEENLLGTGTNLQFSDSHNVDRTVTQVQVNSETVFDTRYRAGVSVADNSDGQTRAFYVERPFYALDTHNAWGVSANRTTQTDSRYDLGEIVDQFNAALRSAQVYYGASHGLQNGWTQRYFAGLRYSEAAFSADPATTVPAAVLPGDRRLAYPWVGLQATQDQYAKGHNQDQIGRTEDLYFGKLLYLELGRSSRAIGADRDAWLLVLNSGAGWRLPAEQEVFLSEQASGRLEDGRLDNAIFTFTGRYYARESERWLFYAALNATQTKRLDADSQVLLGGDTGLRGYPLRFQTGAGSALATVEERFYSRWFPFRLVRVGGAVFADAGRTWGAGVVGGPTLGTLKDVGLGLRLGNSRSGFGNVLHVDVSWALDAPPGIRRYQLNVQTQISY